MAKMCAPTPEERFATARAAIEALSGTAPASGIAMALPTRVPRGVMIGAAAVGVLAVIGTIGAMVAARMDAKRQAELAHEEEQRQIERRRAEAQQASVNVGCADGTREAFKDALTYPQIAGCSGAF